MVGRLANFSSEYKQFILTRTTALYCLLSVYDRWAKYVLAGLISGTGPGTNPGGGREIMSSEFRHVCCTVPVMGFSFFFFGGGHWGGDTFIWRGDTQLILSR